MITTIYSDKDFLEHHGVKGMKWGVRKQARTNMHIRGYRIASKYVQKNDIRKLKTVKKKQHLSNAEYKSEKKKIKIEASCRRGKDLVAHNIGYGKTTINGIAKSSAAILGAATIASMANIVGLPAVAVMASGAGIAMVRNNTVETASRLHDIHTYKKMGGK